MTLRGAVVLGAGDMGARHARAWVAAGVPLRAVADPDLARARATAEPLGAVALRSPEEAIELREADVVSVCTPTFLHPGLAVRALEAGKHVLCEKPVALTAADGAAMARAAAVSARQLRIGLMRRFLPAYPRLVEAVEAIGGPLYALVDIATGVRPKRLMHDAAANGGPVIDMCCHLFEQFEVLFKARPSSLRADGAVLAADKPELSGIPRLAVDTAAITLRYPTGVAQMRVTWGLPGGSPWIEEHSYVGPGGLVRASWPERVIRTTGDVVDTWDAPESDPWRSEVAAFAAELRGQPAPVTVADIDTGLRALRLSLAALHSIAEGGVEVAVSEVQGNDARGDAASGGDHLEPGAGRLAS